MPQDPLPVRLLVIPGLNNSGPAHWQTWLEGQFAGALRVHQRDWAHADLEAWGQAIVHTVAAAPPARWVAVAHSFGCLALARAVGQGWLEQTVSEGPSLAAALMVAPADPEKFEVASALPQTPWALPSVLLGSETDPWMALAQAREWARRWGSHFVNLGPAGHVNVASGHGPFLQAKTLVSLLVHRVQRQGTELRQQAA
ncbi:MAG: alpha/beta hydrolase [Pseudomonadota bacterium]